MITIFPKLGCVRVCVDTLLNQRCSGVFSSWLRGKELFVPKINGFYVSPGTFLTDAKRSVQSRLRLYRRQPPLRLVGNQPVLDSQAAQDQLSAAIINGGPFAAGRLGTVEGDFLSWRIRHPKKAFPLGLLRNGKNLAGIYPANQQAAVNFSDTYLAAVRSLDLLGVRNNDFFNGYFRMERTVVQTAKPMALSSIEALSPFGILDTWVQSLSGKRVLVVHPFASTIRKQYLLNRLEIHPIRDWLPEFKLETYQPFQTTGEENPSNGQTSWASSLAFMLDEISEIQFDVAMIAAGAYGLPLASGIKEMGRSAVHVGGVLQHFFGVRGGRWDPESSKYEHFSKYQSDSWVRPSSDETPVWSKSVEGGAYW
jgi:hypothetical protein